MRMPVLLRAAILIAAVSTATTAWAAVQSASGEADTQAMACQYAKDDAARLIQEQHGATVQRYSACACSQDGDKWVCTVNAYY